MPNSAPLPSTVSVVIPTHNRLHTLKRAIDSVRNQTYAAHEIIVVDDGSTDGTSDWLATLDTPLITLRQKNHGVSHARNRAIEIASGFWIALLDSDDHWYENKLQQQMQALRSNPDSRLCHCDEHWVRNGKRVNPKIKHKKYGGMIFDRCLPLCAISPSAAIMQKDLFNIYGLFDETLPACEDYDMWLRITCNEPVLYLDEALLVKTGGHEDQLSHRYPAMDRFRITALANLIRSNKLSKEQLALASNTANEKARIYLLGATKRDKTETAVQFLKQYADVLDIEYQQDNQRN